MLVGHSRSDHSKLFLKFKETIFIRLATYSGEIVNGFSSNILKFSVY